MEEVLQPVILTVNGALTNVATTFVVASGALQLNPGDVLQVQVVPQPAAYTNELVRVVSVSSDTTFVVTRGAGGTTAAAITTAWLLTRVGNAQSEGNLSIQANSSNPVKFVNYTQIFKTPYQITGTALETRFRTGDPKKNEQKRKAFIHSEKLEQALFWGVANETTDATNGNMPLRYTGGLGASSRATGRSSLSRRRSIRSWTRSRRCSTMKQAARATSGSSTVETAR